jgi:hypothetical protein
MRRVYLAVSILVALAACGGGDDQAIPDGAFSIVVSSDLAVGPQRVAVAVVAPDNTSLATPTMTADLEFLRPDSSAAGTVPTEFIWAIQEVRGLLVADFDFDQPGIWQMNVRTSDGRQIPAGPFQVLEDELAIGVGDPAPPSVTKTAADGTLQEISSDTEPDARFYEMTVAQAVTSGTPSVIVFATPAFCVSATCGPSLDITKSLADEYTSLNWVHVEVFDNQAVAASREELVAVEAVLEWGLQTEPWVYVVDADGIVTARFEGAVGEDELRAAIEEAVAS